MVDAVDLTDLSYDVFIRENSSFFENWKGALSHTELCRMDIKTRFKYIIELNEWIKHKQKALKDGKTIDIEDEEGIM